MIAIARKEIKSVMDCCHAPLILIDARQLWISPSRQPDHSKARALMLRMAGKRMTRIRTLRAAKYIGFGCFIAALMWLERKYSLRRPVENRNARLFRNTGIATLSALTLQLIERPLALKMSEKVARQRLGLLYSMKLPKQLYPIVGTILMDYSLYVWHVMLHRVPFLWRYHLAHHIDLDLDTSTAWRFHFGELIPSVVWRLLQIRLLGINPQALSSWQTFLMACIVFHHSNWRLPLGFERLIVRVLVSPRMHGIHHSIVYEEQNSNWSSGLTLWDRLHGTLRLDVPQESITVGVPAYLDKEAVTFWRTLAVPYTKVENEWKLPPNKRIDG
jgi:sterol desaturase/sphingolipid hydroxylase (fatty acid hydroxylase superfamily)